MILSDTQSRIESAELVVLRSKVQEGHDGWDRIAKFVDESFFSSVQASEEPAGTDETKPDQSTEEVLFCRWMSGRSTNC